MIQWLSVQVRVLPDAAALADAAAGEFTAAIGRAVAERGRCLVALAGGTTPRAAYQKLASFTDARLRLERVEFFWGDERPVPPDHLQSNYRMARETLLGPLQIPPERVHRMRGEARDVDAAAEDYQHEIAVVAGRGDQLPALDFVLLGMGADGHTASLFPGTAALHVTDRWVVANRVPALETTRLTLTFPVILAARRIRVLVAGGDKADALRRVLSGRSDPDALPAQRLRDAEDRVLWLVDAGAGRALEHEGKKSNAAPGLQTG